MSKLYTITLSGLLDCARCFNLQILLVKAVYIGRVAMAIVSGLKKPAALGIIRVSTYS